MAQIRLAQAGEARQRRTESYTLWTTGPPRCTMIPMPARTNPEDGNRPVDSPDAKRGRTLSSVQIENYRVLRDLSVDSLGRVNLFAGQNNSGKTSLLEALFLLSGGGAPQTLANKTVVRGVDSLAGPPETAMETIWKPMFSSLDTEKTIKTTGVHRSQGDLILCIDRKQKDVLSATDVPNAPDLLVSFRTGSGPWTRSRVSLVQQGIQFEQSNVRLPFKAIILAMKFANPKDDAVRLSRLCKRKRGEFVAEALRLVEPRLRNLEVLSTGGVPLVWGDIGLSEFVPLAVMGEGMNRIARIMLAICDAPDGIVLVDDIETGLHHSAMPAFWRSVDGAAKEFNTQVVATTHSYECVQSAVEALGSQPGFLVHRIEANNSMNRCVTYGPKEIAAAIRHNLEIR